MFYSNYNSFNYLLDHFSSNFNSYLDHLFSNFDFNSNLNL